MGTQAFSQPVARRRPISVISRSKSGYYRRATSRVACLLRATPSAPGQARQCRRRPLKVCNYLFAGSDTGGDRAAAMYTIVQTAKLNDLNRKPIQWTHSPDC
jgi:hypothetical protein